MHLCALILALVLSGIASPLAAQVQRAAMPVIGFLNTGSPDRLSHHVRAFRQALGETGYVEGRNVAIEYRWADGQYDRLPALAADLVRRQVTVIVANGPAAPAAKAATATSPIVFVTGVDPVATGLAASLNRPGGNLTGVTTLDVKLGPKLLQMLHESMPAAGVIAALVNPANPASETQSKDLQTAARTLGLQVEIVRASAERDFEAAFATLVQMRAGGLVITSDAFFNSQCDRIAALTLRHALPAISLYRECAAAGSLMSYGTSITDIYTQAGNYTGRILKGEKPADLPVQQATRIELIINLKTAKVLGIKIPQSVLIRATEVIQ
jgi:putative ABC transport system substrate-binding protein